jgi:hypothetical protein
MGRIRRRDGRIARPMIPERLSRFDDTCPVEDTTTDKLSSTG